MSITKKPYEISLWDEQLVWHRRKLEPIQITSKDDYKRGAYYVKSDALGADSYELSYEDYRSTELQTKNPYYQLLAFPVDEDGKIVQEQGKFTEAFDSDELNISPDKTSRWYTFSKTTDTKRDSKKKYYIQTEDGWGQVEDGEEFSREWYEAYLIPNITSSFYKETRLCTIGSDTMDSPARAVNGKLVRKVNGEITFTFTVYYRYYDNETGQLEYNPFMPYLTNERKVKLKYDGEWYDLIIKQIQENSDSKAFTYTCKSQFVNELSKTGFELEFDNELENNMGTVEYLAEQILEGSDWQLEGKSDLKQFIEEPLYKVKIKNDANLTITMMNSTEERNTVPDIAGKEIYVFYSHVNDQQEQWQFLYDDDPFSVNDDLIIDKDIYPNYLIESVSYAEGANWPEFVEYGSITSEYRGMRLVKQVRTIYDTKINKYVQEYKKQQVDENGDLKYGENGKPSYEETTYYGFEETKYLSPNTVNNYIVNPNAFTNTTGWYVQPNAEGAKTTLELVSDPPFNADNIGDENINFTSYLKFTNNGGALINSSINSYKSSLEGFIAGETTYVLRLKCKEFDEENKIGEIITPTAIKIQQYKNMDEFEIEGDAIFEFLLWEKDELTNGQEPDPPFVYYKAVCNRMITQADLQNWDKYYGLFLTFDSQYDKICIEDIQMFPYVLDGDKVCVPGGELFAKIETTKKYYDPTQTYSSLEEVVFEPSGGTYVLKYAEGTEAYTKVSSITAKESNRFNLLQDLNEKFECWARFRVEHNQETGEILYGKDKKWYDEEGNEIECPAEETYRQQKFVSFHEYAGERNYVGFKYGINSKSIQRTLDSNAIVSKMIVKDNANEFARNGFCSIARAIDNSSKENFILNFDHYYRHKLLDLDVVTNDLYMDGGGYLGYYKKLKEINRDREALIDEQANLLKEIANYEAQYQTYKTSHDSALEKRNQMEDNIFLLIVPKEKREEASQLDFPEIIDTYSSGWEEDSSYIKYTTSWMQCDNVIKQHLLLYQKAYDHLNGVKDKDDKVIKQGVKERYNEITELLKEKTEQKRALNLQFYKKYSRFIQEGSWIKEDYIDDNLYYLDSLSTLHTSAQPKVTYNISVIDVSPLPDYEDYEFELGDITYIEDREFFGYSLIDRSAPYREEIVVNEITTELDAPEKNSVKVQNYKTQFEDLFQRIAAQTQQAEYHTGEYNRAAGVVEADGKISITTLENSFANNSLKLSNARDQSVVWDETGITTTSLSNPSEMVRIISGGIFLSTDGGQNWKTGVTGRGINTSYLTSGQINTNEIYIMNGNNAAFRWDEKGLAAYYGQGEYYNPTKFVRFDHNGIYGILASDEWTGDDADIHKNASFALTWSGFSLRNEEGSVRISTEKDIQVLSEKADGTLVERVKIGRLDDTKNPDYGIRIKDADGIIVMETDSGGKLWLRDQLSIGILEKSTVHIGYLEKGYTNSKNETKHEVIHAGDSGSGDTPFIVYEDGKVVANYIEVNGGRIGNITVEQVENATYEVVITSSKGISMLKGTEVVLTAHLYKGNEEVNTGLAYRWYNKTDDNLGTGKTYTIEEVDFNENGYIQYGCEITVS